MDAKETTREKPESLAIETNNDQQQDANRRRRKIACWASVALGLILFIVLIIVLALTVFRSRDPRTELVSVSVEGVSPRVSLPSLRLELNVTLSVLVRVKNRNYAGFRHGPGTTQLMYRETKVGEAQVSPGTIPARGSAEVLARVTLEVDELGSEIGGLVQDVLAGEIVVEASTEIPGRIVFLGFIKKHAVATSQCRFVVGFPELKVRSHVCTSKTKL